MILRNCLQSIASYCEYNCLVECTKCEQHIFCLYKDQWLTQVYAPACFVKTLQQLGRILHEKFEAFISLIFALSHNVLLQYGRKTLWHGTCCNCHTLPAMSVQKENKQACAGHSQCMTRTIKLVTEVWLHFSLIAMDLFTIQLKAVTCNKIILTLREWTKNHCC